jgi:hypothetical protein
MLDAVLGFLFIALGVWAVYDLTFGKKKRK